MKVILREDVRKLGVIGDVVSVRAGFARNWLLPQGKAEPATAEAQADFEKRRAEYEKKQQERRAALASLADAINGYTMQIPARAGPDGKLYGSVTASILCAQLNDEKLAEGIVFRRGQFRLPGGSIKEVGEHEVAIDLGGGGEEVKLKVSVLAEGGGAESES